MAFGAEQPPTNVRKCTEKRTTKVARYNTLKPKFELMMSSLTMSVTAIVPSVTSTQTQDRKKVKKRQMKTESF